MLTRQQMRGQPPASEQPVDPDADTVVDAPVVAPEPPQATPEDDGKLPDHVTENPDGSWTYHLQWPLEPVEDDPEGTDLQKIRIPARVFMRHVLAAAKAGVSSSLEDEFHVLCSATGVPESMMRRIDYFDYREISSAFTKLRLRTVRRRASPPNPS